MYWRFYSNDLLFFGGYYLLEWIKIFDIYEDSDGELVFCIKIG